MRQQKIDPRNEYQQQEKLRISASPSLADRYEGLKALEVALEYFDPGAQRRMGNIKYTVNLANAKSAFSFHCPNSECVGGDFDLSQEVAKAVANQEEEASGEMCCQGWQNKNTIESLRCNHVLRYTLTMTY